MTEIWQESGDDFGLVLGIKPYEWGYFNLEELKGVKCPEAYFRRFFPKTFRELKDTELNKQMDEQSFSQSLTENLVLKKKQSLMYLKK